MRRTGVWLGIVVFVVCAGSASAAITTDGDWSDWFSYAGTASTDWDQAAAAGSTLHAGTGAESAPLATHDGGAGSTDGDGTYPHFGGQVYDVEQIFFFFEDFVPGHDPGNDTGGILHIGLVTGFPPGGTPDYLAGDLFVGFGNGSGLDIAIGVADGEARRGHVYTSLGAPGDLEDVAFPVPGVPHNPYRMNLDRLPGGSDPGPDTVLDVTSFFDGSSAVAGTVDVAWGGDGATEAALAGGSATHYFLEVAIELDGFQEVDVTDPNGGLSLHWTMGCGNDYIDVVDAPISTPIPEPSTMLLLGMGMLGVALRARRPQC